MDVTTAALGYKARGFYCVPIPTGAKGPRISGWQNLRLEEEALRDSFTPKTGNVGLVLGEPSGWLVDVDLDCPEAIELAAKYLPPTGAVTGRTGRENSHWWYFAEGCETARYRDSTRTNGDATTVELRSTGLQTVVGPSTHPDGSTYDMLTDEPATVPAALLQLAVEGLHEAILKERGSDVRNSDGCIDGFSIDGFNPGNLLSSRRSDCTNTTRPGDDYNNRADLPALLLHHGWQRAGSNGNNESFTRPGKATGVSATWNGEHFYVFTSSVAMFEPDRGYRPFEVYTRLEHNGDHTAAAAELGRQGYGSSSPDLSGVDLSGILNQTSQSHHCQAEDAQSSPQGMGGIQPEPEAIEEKIPVEFPPHLLKVPGFVGQVVQYSLKTAHRPQPVLSLWGAICLQAVLSARKLCDPFGSRTNLYVIAMAGSGKGKDHPRVVNRRILTGSGLLELEGPEDLASDAGLLAALAHQPGLLMQLDEVGRLLKSCNAAGAGSSHLYNITSQLLRLYSSTGLMYQGKGYGDRSRNNPIDQPCLTIYGSTVPDSFWGAMSSESIGDGFLARMLPILGDDKPAKQMARQTPVPESILSHAQGWGVYKPGGNLASVHPAPTVVEYTIDAKKVLEHYDDHFEQRGEKSGPWQPVWARARQKAQSLALCYVASQGVNNLRVDEDAILWGCEAAEYCSNLFETVGDHHIADSEFERKCQRVFQAVQARGTEGLSHTLLSRQRCWRSLNPKERQDVMQTLISDHRLRVDDGPRGGVIYFANP